MPVSTGMRNHSVIALEGHSSMQAPQSTHFPASMTAMSSQVIAPSGQTSTHAPHATHSDALTVTILITSGRGYDGTLYKFNGFCLRSG